MVPSRTVYNFVAKSIANFVLESRKEAVTVHLPVEYGQTFHLGCILCFYIRSKRKYRSAVETFGSVFLLCYIK